MSSEEDPDSLLSLSAEEEADGDAPERPPAERPASATREAREMGEGTRNLASSRPGPTRHEPNARKEKPKLQNSLFNYKFDKPLPLTDAKTTKKEKRADQEGVVPEVLFLPDPNSARYLSYFFNIGN